MKERKTNDRWKLSNEMLMRAQRSLPGGVSSPFRANASVPLYFRDGRGCRLEDVDGNQYIDYALAWGPLILGHRHPAMVRAITYQADRPHHYGAQHELEFEVAERIQELVPCAERVAFMSSGSEAVQLACRLARAYTSRNRIVKFEGHYHGWFDSVLISHHPDSQRSGDPDWPNSVLGSRGQVPNATENIIILPWNRPDLVDDLFRRAGTEVAAIITEPVLCNSGCLTPDPGFLAFLRVLCSKYGSLLIFDEVITGFRIALGGAQQHFEVTPDIATLGKALAGGIPLSAVVGRGEILDLMSGGGVAFGGTFNGNPLSLAGAKATLDVLSEDLTVPRANETGTKLWQGIQCAARKYGLPLNITGFGAAFSLHFTSRTELKNYRDVLDDDIAMLNQFLVTALEQGLYLLPDGRIYVSTVHTEEDIADSIDRIEVVFSNMT